MSNQERMLMQEELLEGTIAEPSTPATFEFVPLGITVEEGFRINYTPTGRVTMKNILFTAKNPAGVFLEDILQQLRDEIAQKTAAMDDLDQLHPTVQNYRATNAMIHQLLGQCIQAQTSAIEYAKAAPISVPTDELVEIQEGILVSPEYLAKMMEEEKSKQA